jgi:hypothetical protein
VARGICGLRRRRVLGFEAGGHRLSSITDGNWKADCPFNEKIIGAQRKNPAESHRLTRRWKKLVDPGGAQFGAGKKILTALSFRFEFCYYVIVIDLDPAIIWRYPTNPNVSGNSICPGSLVA